MSNLIKAKTAVRAFSGAAVAPRAISKLYSKPEEAVRAEYQKLKREAFEKTKSARAKQEYISQQLQNPALADVKTYMIRQTFPAYNPNQYENRLLNTGFFERWRSSPRMAGAFLAAITFVVYESSRVMIVRAADEGALHGH